MILFVLLIIFCYTAAEDELLQKCYRECGLSNRVFEERTFEGFRHTFPFTGQLRVSYKPCPDFMMKCSAIIVDEKFIISAKRCLLFDFLVSGKHCKTNSDEAIKNTIVIKEQRYYLPENIKLYTQSNVTVENAENLFQIKALLPLTDALSKLDLVMLELSEKMIFSMELRAACIYGGYSPTTGDVLRFAGYGKIPDVSNSRTDTANDTFVSTQYLHKLNLSVHSEAYCTVKYPDSPTYRFCVDNNLTIGDSGGGAYVDTKGRFYAVAIATEAGVIFDSSKKRQELLGHHFDTLFSITPGVCKSIKRQSKGKVQCSTSLLPPSEECVNRLEDEQKRLAEEGPQQNSQNSQNAQDVWNGGKTEDADLHEIIKNETDGNAIFCYQCNSLVDIDCDSNDIQKLMKYIKLCPQLSPSSSTYQAAVEHHTKGGKMCRKLLQEVEGQQKTIIIRECAYSGSEEVSGKINSELKGYKSYYFSCFNNETNSYPCNTAIAVSFSSGLLFVTAIIVLLAATIHE